MNVEVERANVARILVDGFFPRCEATDRPQRMRASGFREIGLPFETDTGVTRHLAAFLQSHADQPGAIVRPTHVLFNGGVFKSPLLRDRLLEVLGHWFPGDQTPRLIEGEHDLDHAAARGAACYGFCKHRGGIRIRGGTARAYYIGIETAGLAVPGAARPLQALCVAPIGMEEGTEADIPGAEIGLVVGEPAHFRFFSSSTRKQDRPGDRLAAWSSDELAETDSLEAVLPAEEAPIEGYVPVRFHSRITELGVLELWCVGPHADRRWKLEFSVREDAE